MSDTYDYIVVGGGSAGCIVAAELSADPAVRVLLLEGGPAAEENPETLAADGYKHAFANERLMWERFSEPQRACAGNRLFLGSGRGVGGSGGINGMVYTRGSVFDYRAWGPGVAVGRRAGRLRRHRGAAAPAPHASHRVHRALHPRGGGGRLRAQGGPQRRRACAGTSATSG